MKNLTFSSLTLLFVIVLQANAQQSTSSSFFESYVMPHFVAYGSCAKQHLEMTARRDALSAFDRIEGSLRPACGAHIDQARRILAGAGLDRTAANSIIRTAYDAMQPELRSTYEQAAAQERQRRQSEREEIAAQQRARDAELAQQEQAKEAARERDNLLKEAASNHEKCISERMKEVVPFSNESAETFGTYIRV